MVPTNPKPGLSLCPSSWIPNFSDPLILWLNGGPGCSSVGGLFEELGPYYPEQSGETLYENVFSWNKVRYFVN